MVQREDQFLAFARIQETINAFGLILNMIGVVVIFFYGPPQPVLEEGVAIAVEDATPIDASGKTAADYNEEVRQRRKQFFIRSRIGLCIIFIGFGIQLIASVI